MQRIHYGLYLLFAAFNFLMCLHVFLAYPETKGYTLEEMDVVFQYNPRKKVPQEVLDQFMAGRNETRESGLASSDASEKKVEA
ncbi:hypothetical protein G6F36_014025 [Rhizopus arrhizus]|nr:hypothetical protein G6F36_014025 [Rhizopus arrhizus]